MKKLLKDFKEFAVKGNMIDMAIGIIIGAAFNKVVNVLVYDIILPPLSLLTKGINLVDRKIVLEPAVTDASGTVIQEEAAIRYGALIEVAMDFLIVGFTIFLAVKVMNRLKKKSEDTSDASVATPKDIELLTQLKNLMEDQNKLLSEQLKNKS
jgi:large conductance mechanosensitive channel